MWYNVHKEAMTWIEKVRKLTSTRMHGMTRKHTLVCCSVFGTTVS